MGAKIYRIKIEEFNINNSYSYNFDSPKAIPLHKYIKKQLEQITQPLCIEC